MNYHGTGCIISETLVLGTEKNRSYADSIDSGQHVDRAQNIPADRLFSADLAWRVARFSAHTLDKATEVGSSSEGRFRYFGPQKGEPRDGRLRPDGC